MFRGEGLGDSPPPSWRRGEPGASYLVGAAEPPARRRLQHAAPGRRRRAAGIAAARTRVGWGGADTRGPRGASPPAARKARNGGPRPDSCSGEAAAAGNTKRLIQPRWGGREGREGGIEEKIEGGGKKKAGKKERKRAKSGRDRRGAGAVLGSPRRAGARGSAPGTAPASPSRSRWGSARFVIPPPPRSLFLYSPRHRERLKPRQSK